MTEHSHGVWIDGAVYASGGNERIPVTNAYSTLTWGSIAKATAADVEHAVDSAARCFRDTWSKVNGHQRGRMLNALADLLDRHAERLAELETRSNGKLYKETLTQMPFFARSYRYNAGWPTRFTANTCRSTISTLSIFRITDHTHDVSRAHRVAQRMEAGNVWVNTYRMGAVQAPFGGVKGSGFGKERGIEGLRSYLSVHNLMIDTSAHDDDPFSIRT